VTYLEFERTFNAFPIFSVKDIKKQFPDFDSRRLVEWQHKGYLLKVRRGYYCFVHREKGGHYLYFAANKVYSPSYISMESALAYYNFIPEGVFTATSITTKNTANYDTPIGHFEYRHVKPSFFFGYKLLRGNEFTIKIAEPEKVILDYLYLNSLNDKEQIESMRINSIQVIEQIDFNKLELYQKIFSSSVLDKRVRMFNQVIHA